MLVVLGCINRNPSPDGESDFAFGGRGKRGFVLSQRCRSRKDANYRKESRDLARKVTYGPINSHDAIHQLCVNSYAYVAVRAKKGFKAESGAQGTVTFKILGKATTVYGIGMISESRDCRYHAMKPRTQGRCGGYMYWSDGVISQDGNP